MSWLSDRLGIDVNLTGGGGKTPTLQRAEMPAIAQEELKNIISTAKQSPEEFAKQSQANVETGIGMLGAPQMGSYAQTGVQPAQLQAFRNVYGAQTGKAMEQLKAHGAIAAEQKKMQRLQIASNLMLEQSDRKTAYLQSLTNAYNQMEAQRAALISNIAGTAGQAVGMYYGSKPKGIGTGNYTPDATIQQSSSAMNQPSDLFQSNYYGSNRSLA